MMTPTQIADAFVVMLVCVCLCLCVGCEDYTGLTGEDDHATESYESLKDGTIIVKGDAAESKLDTVGGPVIIEGSIEGVQINTAPEAEGE